MCAFCSDHMVFWTDSFEKAIKRSYIPGDKADAEIGFAQDLQIKSGSTARLAEINCGCGRLLDKA